ncbi:hypothetical protein N7492_007060 [Penicillium capsulatum]|uniref:Uncharacterized protein n=1 Tax=Penicillium capsulatum TaxID=69766 RepID=A0A9W9I1C1_9EURO|nr:hypothetical protein N7492_007060 [Penicillium capsulatum]KAJ6116894.1 hypothetical protein N7512_006619 [Penicillium capsulatum]
MSDATYHTTRQDLRKAETKAAQQHGGANPSNSEVSQMKSIVDQNSNKSAQIDRTKANLPLPEDPPVASDWNSADQRTVNVGSGGIEGPVSGDGDSALRGPATAESSARVAGSELHQNTAPLSNVGRQRVEGLDGLPSDATTR